MRSEDYRRFIDKEKREAKITKKRRINEEGIKGEEKGVKIN